MTNFENLTHVDNYGAAINVIHQEFSLVNGL